MGTLQRSQHERTSRPFLRVHQEHFARQVRDSVVTVFFVRFLHCMKSICFDFCCNKDFIKNISSGFFFFFFRIKILFFNSFHPVTKGPEISPQIVPHLFSWCCLPLLLQNAVI